MQLSEFQSDKISNYLDNEGVELESLKNDLHDHLCCVVEDKMVQGMSFESAFAQAIRQVTPQGALNIQQQTIFLINLSKISRMKKLMYSIGLLSSISVALGWLMTLLHLPGGNKLFSYGFVALVLVFVPMLAYDRYKLNTNRILTEKLKLIFGFSSAFLAGLGVVFKLLHLMGAGIILAIGVLLFAFAFLPFLFLGLYKSSLEEAVE